jgi:hypothetical protein
MFIMTAALWDDLSRINSLCQDVDDRTGEVASDDRLSHVNNLLGDDSGDAVQSEYTGSDEITRNRIRLSCIYEGDPQIVIMGRAMMWIE